MLKETYLNVYFRSNLSLISLKHTNTHTFPSCCINFAGKGKEITFTPTGMETCLGSFSFQIRTLIVCLHAIPQAACMQMIFLMPRFIRQNILFKEGFV